MTSSIGLLKLLGNETRLKIAFLLHDGEKTSEQIALATGQNVQTFTHHLTRFRNRGFVKCRRMGKKVIYSLNDPQGDIGNLLEGVSELYFKNLH